MKEKELREIFHQNIKKFRVRNNWSQVVLAQKAGISVNFINDIEAGKKWASPASMIKIADALDVEVYELLKPPGLPADSLSSLIREYVDSVNNALTNVRIEFLQNNS